MISLCMHLIGLSDFFDSNQKEVITDLPCMNIDFLDNVSKSELQLSNLHENHARIQFCDDNHFCAIETDKKSYSRTGKEGYFLDFSNFDSFNGKYSGLELIPENNHHITMRYFFMIELLKACKFTTPHADFINLKVNDHFKGLYLMRENFSKSFFSKHGYNQEFVFKHQDFLDDFSLNAVNEQTDVQFEKMIKQKNTSLADLLLTFDIDEILTMFDASIDIEEILNYYALSIMTGNFNDNEFSYYLCSKTKNINFSLIPAISKDAFSENNKMKRITKDQLPFLLRKIILNANHLDLFLSKLEDVSKRILNDIVVYETLTDISQIIEDDFYRDPLIPKDDADIDFIVDEIASFVKLRKNILHESLLNSFI